MEIMDVDGASCCFLSWFCVSHIRANSRETAHCIGELVIETPSQARMNTACVVCETASCYIAPTDPELLIPLHLLPKY